MTLTGFKDFIKSPQKWVIDPSGLQDKDSGALFLLTVLSKDRSGVYKHKIHKQTFVAKLQLQFPPIRDQRLGAFLVCSIIVN